MKDAATGIGLAVLGLGIAVNGLNLNGNQANATTVGLDRGPAEPVIVAFGYQNWGNSGFWRLWSDGTIEVRFLAFRGPGDLTCDSSSILSVWDCGNGVIPYDTSWLTVPDPPGGNGFACRSDINGDRNIDAEDLGLLLAGWGQEISCDPQPTYPCFDLDGLNMNMAAR